MLLQSAQGQVASLPHRPPMDMSNFFGARGKKRVLLGREPNSASSSAGYDSDSHSSEDLFPKESTVVGMGSLS